MAPIRSAALVLVRSAPDAEDLVLLVQRGLTNLQGRPMSFAGAWVLPGGKVDHGESVAVAAAREAREEVGLTVDARSLQELWELQSTATDGRVFATTYLRAPAPPGVEPVPAPGELQGFRWIRPAEALRLADLGEMDIPPATRATLERLVAAGAAR